jgi:hypothetical protein
MQSPELLDLYSDYLLSSFSLVTATGLSTVLNHGYSHDKITRFLEQDTLDQKVYWEYSKEFVRQVENEDSVLIIDDFISEKPYTHTSPLVCYHYDHTTHSIIRGINIVNFLLYSELSNGETVSIPVAFEPVRKPITETDATGKEHQKSEQTKNELVRNRLKILVYQNAVKFKYVLWDSWYSSKENMEFVVLNLQKNFIGAIKSNRTVAMSYADKLAGTFKSVSDLDIQPGQTYTVYLRGVEFPLLLVKQIFKNGDGSVGIVYLITNDTTLSYEQIITIYKKRWKVEESHKSLKQNCALEKSPTKIERSQLNHIFCAFVAFIKMERIKIQTKVNHFALKGQIYLAAVKHAMQIFSQYSKPQDNNPIHAAMV